MKKRLLFLYILLLVSYCSFSQNIGIGTITPDSSAVLDITHTAKGLLIPRMSTGAILSITKPAKGLMIYDSTANQMIVNTGTTAAPSWQLAASNNNVWKLTGNNNIDPVNQFIGTTDNQPLRFRVNNIPAGELNPVTGSIFWGLRAGNINSTGLGNIAIGTDALRSNTNGTLNTSVGANSLQFNTTGFSNTAIGVQTLNSNTSGSNNTAIGRSALTRNTTGSDNTANGLLALFSNTTGKNNTASGSQSLMNNTAGNGNTAAGFFSLNSNSSGNDNTAVGISALADNSTGGGNTGIGSQALVSNISGSSNTGIGSASLFLNNDGFSNTAVGQSAMSNNISGSFNVGVGQNTLFSTFSSQENTAVGFNAASLFNMGFNNTIIGSGADVNQSGLFNCVALGNNTRCTASSQVRLGNSFTTSIGGVVGYTNLSDGRYKKNIQESVKGIDFIMKLRPVMYQLDVAGINQKLNVNTGKEMSEQSKQSMAEQEKTVFSGFVAQEVEQAAKTVGYDFSGVDKPKNENDMYGLRYAEFVVPLVKAVQEQQQIINELMKQNIDLKKRMTALEKK